MRRPAISAATDESPGWPGALADTTSDGFEPIAGLTAIEDASAPAAYVNRARPGSPLASTPEVWAALTASAICRASVLSLAT